MTPSGRYSRAKEDLIGQKRKDIINRMYGDLLYHSLFVNTFTVKGQVKDLFEEAYWKEVQEAGIPKKDVPFDDAVIDVVSCRVTSRLKRY